jgi:threonine 3-dehydrogenase
LKALVKAIAGRGLKLQEVPVPKVGPKDVLIRVQRTAICGTDLHIYKWDDWAQRTVPVPLVIGHEFSGLVAEVGGLVTGFLPGDFVSGEGHLTCGLCRQCRGGVRHLCPKTRGIGYHVNGAFAEYLVLPEENVYRVPKGVPQRVAAILDPLGNAAHTALSFSLVGENVLITGAGPVGMMAAAIAKKVGARSVVITDVNPERLALASALGATRVVNMRKDSLAKVMEDLEVTDGFDVGLEMSGHPDGIETLFKNMTWGGKVALLGLPTQRVPLDFDKLIFGGLMVKGIYGREIFETWHKMTALLSSGLEIESVITHEFSYGDFEKAFAVMESGEGCKILLNWT